jgi:hypothetical protein
MSETRYPNESAEYRSARDKLLEESWWSKPKPLPRCAVNSRPAAN